MIRMIQVPIAAARKALCPTLVRVRRVLVKVVVVVVVAPAAAAAAARQVP